VITQEGDQLLFDGPVTIATVSHFWRKAARCMIRVDLSSRIASDRATHAAKLWPRARPVSLLYQRLAALAARILRGAKLSEIQIEQPTKFELIVNLKTAKVLKVKIPRSILVRADPLIE
jgi:hypothetical protein